MPETALASAGMHALKQPWHLRARTHSKHHQATTWKSSGDTHCLILPPARLTLITRAAAYLSSVSATSGQASSA